MYGRPMEVYATGTQQAGTNTLLGRILYEYGKIDDRTFELLSTSGKSEFAEIPPALVDMNRQLEFRIPTGKDVRLYTNKSPEVLNEDKVEECRIGILVVTPDVIEDSESEDMEAQLCMLECVDVLIVLVNKMDESHWNEKYFLEACERVRMVLTANIAIFGNLSSAHFIPTSGLCDENVFLPTAHTASWREGFHTYLRTPYGYEPMVPADANPKLSLMLVLAAEVAAIEDADIRLSKEAVEVAEMMTGMQMEKESLRGQQQQCAAAGGIVGM